MSNIVLDVVKKVESVMQDVQATSWSDAVNEHY